jgi:hypothetical protein
VNHLCIFIRTKVKDILEISKWLIETQIFFKNQNFGKRQTALFIGGINICEFRMEKKIDADGRNFRKEP